MTTLQNYMNFIICTITDKDIVTVSGKNLNVMMEPCINTLIDESSH